MVTVTETGQSRVNCLDDLVVIGKSILLPNLSESPSTSLKTNEAVMQDAMFTFFHPTNQKQIDYYLRDSYPWITPIIDGLRKMGIYLASRPIEMLEPALGLGFVYGDEALLVILEGLSKEQAIVNLSHGLGHLAARPIDKKSFTTWSELPRNLWTTHNIDPSLEAKVTKWGNTRGKSLLESFIPPK